MIDMSADPPGDRPWCLLDVYFDPLWIAALEKGKLPLPRATIRGTSASTGVEIEQRIYGDDDRVRHLRVILKTADGEAAQRCIRANIQTWVAALEVAASIEAGQPVTVAHVPGTAVFMTTFGRSMDGEEPACIVSATSQRTRPVHYPSIGAAAAVWGLELHHYLFFFRRFIDTALPVDVRWLYGYRVIEWHFLKRKGRLKLPKAPEYLAWVGRFDSQLAPLCRSGQRAVGLIEEARALAAHAQVDLRTQDELAINPQNILEQTFPALNTMVMTILNEHPAKPPGFLWTLNISTPNERRR